jgi:hypothetical protein
MGKLLKVLSAKWVGLIILFDILEEFLPLVALLRGVVLSYPAVIRRSDGDVMEVK